MRQMEFEEIFEDYRVNQIPYSRRIFCNRTLRMDVISLIGFDMDYTLSLYHKDLENLQWDLTLERLVQERNYPKEILNFIYNPEFPLRGLVIDLKKGNILKLDRHKFVWRVFHGTDSFEKELRREIYRNDIINLSSKRFYLVDTLFSLPEVYMFARFVDFYEKEMKRKLTSHDYKKFYKDIRETMDEIHRDGSLKLIIKNNLQRYIIKDPDIPLVLHKFRSAGKKLFLMTNSQWDYVDKVMSYLLGGRWKEYPSWKNFFDWIIVEANKNEFFRKRNPFIEIQEDGKVCSQKCTKLEKGKIYKGGNLKDFEKFTGFKGEQIIYIGDNIYTDILRSKKDTSWRTALIIQEMEAELLKMEKLKDEFKKLRILESQINQLNLLINANSIEYKKMKNEKKKKINHDLLNEKLNSLHNKIEELKEAICGKIEEAKKIEGFINSHFNPYFGALFKESVEHSIFGEQVEEYACIYTSRASNFLYYSPVEYFHSSFDLLPHENLLI